MSSAGNKPITIPLELETEMTPAVRIFVQALLDRIAQLERGRKTPQNSSLPPSAQHPHARPQTPKRKSKKKRGGQPGHEKHARPLIPTEQCDDVQALQPTECRRCGSKLSGSDSEPRRHQVWELPEIKPLVTEYQQHRLYVALAKYQKKHGDCQVSTLSQTDAQLGNWVRTQRAKRHKGTLSAEYIRRLDQLGFTWDATPE